MSEGISPEEVFAKVEVIRSAFREIDLVDLDTITAIDQRFLNKGGELSQLSRNLVGYAPEEKRRVGEVINALRSEIKVALEEARQVAKLAAFHAAEASESMDLSAGLVRRPHLGVGSLHPVTITRHILEDIFLGMGFSIAHGPEVETEWNNFEALNIPKFHPARDAQDSFFVDYGEAGEVLLRTHTSPVQIRLMMSQNLPIYSVMPGRVFRRDTADARHTPGFHQIEGLVVDEGITFEHLAGTIDTFTKAYFGPDIQSRLRPAYFPFTEPSGEFEVTCTICLGEGCRTCSQTGWIELGGCGMVHPNVFEAVGIDHERYSGFAFGFGIDRLSQMRYAIADMRVFLDNDVRFLRQFKGE